MKILSFLPQRQKSCSLSSKSARTKPVVKQGGRQNQYVTISVESWDDVEKTVTAKVSSLTPDRDGHSVLPSAIMKRLDTFFKNPVFLWDHRHYGDPDDVLGTVQKIDVLGDDLIVTFKYDTDINPKAKSVFDKVKRGTLRAFSVGFLAHEYHTTQHKSLPSKVNKWLKSGEVTVAFTDVELIEISQVIIPAHPDAVVRSLKALKQKFSKSNQPTKPTNKPKPTEEVHRKMEPEEMLIAVAKSLGLEVEVKEAQPQELNAEAVSKSITKAKDEIMAQVATMIDGLRSEFSEGIEEMLSIVLPAEEGEAAEAAAEEAAA